MIKNIFQINVIIIDENPIIQVLENLICVLG